MFKHNDTFNFLMVLVAVWQGRLQSFDVRQQFYSVVYLVSVQVLLGVCWLC